MRRLVTTRQTSGRSRLRNAKATPGDRTFKRDRTRSSMPETNCANFRSYADFVFGLEGFLKITRRQQIKKPVKASTAGTSPKVVQSASPNHPNLPKCSSESRNRLCVVKLSAGSIRYSASKIWGKAK